MSVPKSKPSHCFDHSTDQNSGRCHGCTAVPNGHGSFHRPIASVFRVYGPTGTRSRRCQTRCLRNILPTQYVRTEGKGSNPCLRTPNRQIHFRQQQLVLGCLADGGLDSPSQNLLDATAAGKAHPPNMSASYVARGISDPTTPDALVKLIIGPKYREW